MYVLKEIFTEGISATSRSFDDRSKRASFWSEQDKIRYVGELVGTYTEEIIIVHYLNAKGKKMLALVNERENKVACQNLLYVSKFKGGMAVACQTVGNKVDVILLNIRGQNVCNLGQRYKLYTPDVREMVK